MSDLHHQVWNNFVFLGSTKNSKISIFFKRRKAFKLDPKNSFCSSMDKLDICCLCITELTLPKQAFICTFYCSSKHTKKPPPQLLRMFAALYLSLCFLSIDYICHQNCTNLRSTCVLKVYTP